jgi:hypothetical protein
MLPSFHNAVYSQKWDQAINYIISHRCDPNEKGENGLSARELACDNINKIVPQEFFWGRIWQTPLECNLMQESQHGIKGEIETTKALISLGANVNQKNDAGDNALMCYLKRFSFPTHGKEKNWPSLKIIRLLISQGADFTPNNKQENPLDFAKNKFGEPVSRYMKKLIGEDPKSASAIKFQRAWRKLQYQEKNMNNFGKNSFGPRPANEIVQQFPIHPKLSLQPKIPQSDNAIDPLKAQEWVNMHDKEDQTLAAKILKKIDHVSFDRFIFGLKASIEKWNTLIMSRPESQRNYAILLDDRDEKSIQWVTSLALPWLAHPPTQIITFGKLETIKKDIQHLVIIDDAVYSGNQMTGFLDELDRTRILPQHQHLLNKECHIIVPFISENGKKRLSEREVNIIHHETIPNFKIEGLDIGGQTATYFAHKIAQEGTSTISIISSGETIRRKPGVRFIPSTHEPYKSKGDAKTLRIWFLLVTL